MEAFKLLSRSTNLKAAQISRQENRALHVPSEGWIATATTGVDDARAAVSKPVVASRKRKRNSTVSEPNIATPQSASCPSSPSSTSGVINDESKGQSTERTVPDTSSLSFSGQVSSLESSKSPEGLSPLECRSVFKSHKVKITALTRDMGGVMADGVDASFKAIRKQKTARVEQLSKKKQKEISRIYVQPLTSFTLLSTHYNASKALAGNIRKQGYFNPTEVQLATIPLLLNPAAAGLQLPQDVSHVDLLTVAPTGSGKTLAFLIPLINHLVNDHHTRESPSLRHVSALVVAPTKELVGQIVNEGRKLCANTGVFITAMRKRMLVTSEHTERLLETGDEKAQEIKSLDEPLIVKADILVTTPLLLANAVTENESNLSCIRHLVLDEADVLLDPLFRDQTLSLWNACTNPSLRLSMWSATIGSNIEELVIHLIEERKVRLTIPDNAPLLRCVIGLKDSALPTISHKLIYTATEPGKLLGIRQLLHPSTAYNSRHTAPSLRPPFLVFTQTIERAVALHAELLYDVPTEAGGASRIAVLHSDLSDLKRSNVMTRFRKGQIWVLITTDLLSRGVDFRGVNGVVNYDIPTSSAAYVHRVGRTGRAGRAGGLAVTFYTRDDIKYVKSIANAISASEKARGKTEIVRGGEGVQRWLLNALPDISKKDRQELKKRGVDVRRKMRSGEDEKGAKAKRRARISTKSGYERRLENNRRGAIAGGQDRQDEKADEGDGADWGGFDG